jgi:hypothetical protein
VATRTLPNRVLFTLNTHSDSMNIREGTWQQNNGEVELYCHKEAAARQKEAATLIEQSATLLEREE